MEPVQLLAIAAAAAALASAAMRTMPALRLIGMGAAAIAAAYALAVGSNWLLIAGVLGFAAHAWRYVEARATVRRLADADEPRPTALFAFVGREQHAAETILFRKDEPGEEMYLIVEGWIELVEIGKRLGPGQVLGEVAMVVPSHRRTLTARAVTPVTLARMTKRDMELTALQNPAFGFEMLRLVSRRLSEDIDRLSTELNRRGGD